MPKTIYLLRSGENFKIGRTTNWSKRFATYKGHNPDISIVFTVELPENANIAEAEDLAIRRLEEEGYPRANGQERGEWFIGDSQRAADLLRKLFPDRKPILDIAPFCRPVPPFPRNLSDRLGDLREAMEKLPKIRSNGHREEHQRHYTSCAEFEGDSLRSLAKDLGLGSYQKPADQYKSYVERLAGPCFRKLDGPVPNSSRHYHLDMHDIIEHGDDRTIGGQFGGGHVGVGTIYDHTRRFFVGPYLYAIAAASYVPTKEGYEALPIIENRLVKYGWRAMQLPEWQFYVTSDDLGTWLFIRDESPEDLLTSWGTSFPKWAEDNYISLISRRREWCGKDVWDREDVAAADIEKVLSDLKNDAFFPIETQSWDYALQKVDSFAGTGVEQILSGEDLWQGDPPYTIYLGRLLDYWLSHR